MMGKRILAGGLLLTLLVNLVFADGKVFSGLDISALRPVNEDEQRAFIAHKDGREAMVLTVNFDVEDNEKAFWLFPVLGSPEEVSVDVFNEFPALYGKDPLVEARAKIMMLTTLQFFTQPYLYPFFCVTMSTSSFSRKGIDVYNEVEKGGLRIETLTGDSLESLTAYLQSKGIGIETPEIQVYEEYLTGNYTLILVTISSQEELRAAFPDLQETEVHSGRRPCVYVEFPAEHIFFPLKPTGTYNDAVNISLRVVGHVKPTNGVIRPSWHYRYFYTKQLPDDFPDRLVPFLGQTPLEYTRIEFLDDAGLLTEDLFLTPATIPGIKYAEVLQKFFDDRFTMTVMSMAVIAIQSWFCAGLVGLCMGKRWMAYANLGPLNLMTLMGMCLAAKYADGPWETDIRGENGKSFRSKFTWLFALFFVSSTVLLHIILRVPLFLR